MDHHLTRRLLLVGSGSLLLAGCSLTTTLAPIETGTSTDATAEALGTVNALRKRNGKPALFNDPIAANAARDHAIRMARYGKMSHDVGSDKTFLARMKRMDVPLPAAENIATGQDTVERALAAWIKSRHHLDNMLGPFTGLGVAVASNQGTGNRPYWAMILSSSPGRFSLRS